MPIPSGRRYHPRVLGGLAQQPAQPRPAAVSSSPQSCWPLQAHLARRSAGLALLGAFLFRKLALGQHPLGLIEIPLQQVFDCRKGVAGDPGASVTLIWRAVSSVSASSVMGENGSCWLMGTPPSGAASGPAPHRPFAKVMPPASSSAGGKPAQQPKLGGGQNLTRGETMAHAARTMTGEARFTAPASSTLREKVGLLFQRMERAIQGGAHYG